MSNVLYTAFYLARPQQQACLGNSLRGAGAGRLRGHCGAAIRKRKTAQASAALIADWQPPSLVAFYTAGAILSANVSSAAAKPAPLIRPAQSVPGRTAAVSRQQS